MGAWELGLPRSMHRPLLPAVTEKGINPVVRVQAKQPTVDYRGVLRLYATFNILYQPPTTKFDARAALCIMHYALIIKT